MHQQTRNLSRPMLELLRKTRVLGLARRVAPATYQNLKQYYSIKRQVKDGYALVDLPELEREYEKGVRWLVQAIGANAIGDYLEFGVFYGSSLACMHRILDKFGLKQVRLFGFDSFEGLPESKHPDDRVWGTGEFKSSYKFAKEFLTQSQVDWQRVFLEKGWFNETLTADFLQKHKLKKANLIMVDCDMYVSAKQALDFCAPLIQDHAIIYFDDWNSGDKLAERGEGEKRAFDEFLQENPRLKAEEFGSYSYQGRMHAKVFKVSATN